MGVQSFFPVSFRRVAAWRNVCTVPRVFRLFLVLTVVTCMLGLRVHSALAMPGDLDPSFDSDGIVVTNAVSELNTTTRNVLMAVQADGRVVLVGGPDPQDQTTGFVLARLLANGSLDTSFGTGGTVRILPQVGTSASAMLMQPDGKIVVGGHAIVSGPTGMLSGALALFRFTSAGVLDTSFGTGGVVYTLNPQPFGGISGNSILALALRADGRIVAAAHGSGGSGLELVRYNTNGSLDTSFGSGGRELVNTFPQSSLSPPGQVAVQMLLQADGRIVLLGRRVYPGSKIARFNADGSVDTSFGSAGVLTVADVMTPGLALLPDGKLVLAGTRVSPTDAGSPSIVSRGLVLARFLPNGGVDTAFGTNGRFTAGVNGQGHVSEPAAVVVQADGKLVVGGASPLSGFSLTRFTPGGALDPTFGLLGQVRTTAQSATGGLTNISSLALAPDGKVVAVGSYFSLGSSFPSSARNYPALVRYQTSGGGGVGGTGFGITPQSTSISLSWKGGTSQTGYLLARAPSASWAPPVAATSYSDPAPPAGLDCYQLLALAPSSVLARSDALCAQRGMRSPSGVPTDFILRLNQSATARLSWNLTDTQIGYALVALKQGQEPRIETQFPWTGGADVETGGVPTCYILYAVYESSVSNTDLVCALPGQSQFSAASSSSSLAASRGIAAVDGQSAVRTTADALDGPVLSLRQEVIAKLPAVRERVEQTATRLRGKGHASTLTPAPSAAVPTPAAPHRHTAR